MFSDNNIKKYIEESNQEIYSLLETICKIPAPSHHEEKRAEFVKNWFDSIGAEGAYIDEALNVVLPINCEGSNEITVFVAHTDTVFPDLEPMPYEDDGEIIRCPGVGDDTASLVDLMLAAKYFVKNNFKPQNGIMFVANSCEEGLGNLKGTRQIMKDYEGRVKQFISIDNSKINGISNRCVGSHRYEVEVKTPGGHSFAAFGNKNAIAELSKMINEMYSIEVPKKEDTKTTYNVGIISGGTSVNTICQDAKMLCEYRSNDVECLEIMKNKFEEIFENARCEDVEVIVTKIGDRPCAKAVDPVAFAKLQDTCAEILEKVSGKEIEFKSSSTDCNIPLHLGIPAICIGGYEGGKAHTREEWLYKKSLPLGLESVIKIAYRLTSEE